MKKTHIWSIVAIFAALGTGAPAVANPLPGICDVLGNAPIGGDTVSTASTAESGAGSRAASFAPDIQSKINAAGATFTAASLSGSQTVGGATVEVDPAIAQTTIETIGSAPGTETPAVASLATALGGGDTAQQLAKSMQGLRRSDGSIDPVVLTGAVDSYNSYIKALVASSQVTQKPSSELDSFVRSLPAGQKVAQVVLGKLTEAAK